MDDGHAAQRALLQELLYAYGPCGQEDAVRDICRRELSEGLTLALEVGPTEEGYGTTVSGRPIVGYVDALCVYDKSVADRLMQIAGDQGQNPQAAVLGAFESDASHAKAGGLTARAGLLCLPTLSTHGYEVVAREAISAMVDVLVEFLSDPGVD